MFRLASFLVLLSVLGLSFAQLKCYVGHQRWDPEPVINTFDLTNCARGDRCCYMLSTLNGTYYGCYRDCPSTTSHACGPDPQSGIMDITYCYCNNYRDSNCKPFGALQ
ncbi:hypothetical protein L596_004438 [Steinernema carpocapsae]|uniref:EGF-like domain-containing protein n=1 Tax=Steinernema carpocapsae TaxID=34508 RepID=A0A4U8UXB6_STECR|nr:hypothetical protein L596_004438 [Steinernema carpocapsae]